MSNIVSVTAQGQISIPVKLRRELNIDRKKVEIRREANGLFIEPIADILSLKGSLKHKAKKAMNIDQIIKLEKKAWEQAAAVRYGKNLK